MRSALFAIMVALAIPTAAAAAPSPACPTGEIARVRLSTIKPASSMAAFRAAVSDHLAWYKGHGFKIEQTVIPVLDYDRATNTESVSKTEVMTIATGESVPLDKRDAGWDAYVAHYRASSDMVSEKLVCLPHR